MTTSRRVFLTRLIGASVAATALPAGHIASAIADRTASVTIAPGVDVISTPEPKRRGRITVDNAFGDYEGLVETASVTIKLQIDAYDDGSGSFRFAKGNCGLYGNRADAAVIHLPPEAFRPLWETLFAQWFTVTRAVHVDCETGTMWPIELTPDEIETGVDTRYLSLYMGHEERARELGFQHMVGAVGAGGLRFDDRYLVDLQPTAEPRWPAWMIGEAA